MMNMEEVNEDGQLQDINSLLHSVAIAIEKINDKLDRKIIQ